MYKFVIGVWMYMYIFKNFCIYIEEEIIVVCV